MTDEGTDYSANKSYPECLGKFRNNQHDGQTIKYNNKIKKHEMTITRRGNANGNILNDADAKKKFVKVPFE